LFTTSGLGDFAVSVLLIAVLGEGLLFDLEIAFSFVDDFFSLFGSLFFASIGFGCVSILFCE